MLSVFKRRLSFVMNMIDTRRNFDRHIDELIAGPHEDVQSFKIKQDVKVSYASACGVHLFDYAPKTNAALAIADIGAWCDHGKV